MGINKKDFSKSFKKTRGKVVHGWENTATEVKYGAAAALGVVAAVAAVIAIKKHK